MILAAAALVLPAPTLLAPAGAQAVRPLGTLTQLEGGAGCVSFSGIDGIGGNTCATATEVADPDAPAVSPDGNTLYVGIYGSSSPKEPEGIAIFARNQSTGTIAQLPGRAGCITEDGSSDQGGGTCTSGRGISSPDGQPPTFTRDGRFVYYASQGNSTFKGAVDVFARDTSSGALTQLAGTAGCVSQDGASPSGGAGSCSTAPSIDGPVTVVLSPDERFLYVYSYDTPYTGITIFSRDPSTGALTLVPGTAGCLTRAGESAAGAGTCATLRGESNSEGQGFVISPDGRFAYATDYGSGSEATVQLFSRDPSTGVLTQLSGLQGCISNTGASVEGANTCTKVHGIDGAYVLGLSPDGNTLVIGAYDRGLAIFKRDPNTGLLTQLGGTAGCISDDGLSNDPTQPCLQANAAAGAYRLQFGPEDRTLLEASNSDNGIQSYAFDATSGEVKPIPGTTGCVTYDGNSPSGAGTCQVGRALHGSYGLSISPDGAFVYAAGERSDGGIAVFSRSAAPICNSLSAMVPFATPTSLTPPCHDPNGDPFTVQALSAPAHGTLSASGGSFAFSPAGGFSGADSFAFDATGAKGSSLPASATLTVAGLVPPRPLRATMAFVRVSNSNGFVSVTIECLAPGSTCNGPISLEARLPVTVVKKVKHGRRKIKRKVVKTLTVASGRVSIAAGSTHTYKLRLSSTALKRLLSQHHLALSIKITLAEPAPPTAAYSKSFTAKVKVKKHKGHKKRHG